MNAVFLILVASAFLTAAWNQFMQAIPKPRRWMRSPRRWWNPPAARWSLPLAGGGHGAFLGLMKIAEEGGLLTILARIIRP